MEDIGINNIADLLAPRWNKQKIKTFDNQAFDALFQIENIPLSWFYKRLLSFHTIPPQFQTKQLVLKYLNKEEIKYSSEIDTKRKKLQKLYFLNEKVKIALYGNKKVNLPAEKPNVLLLTYLDHANQEGEIFRLNNLLKIMKEDQILHPLTITATPPSKKFYSTIKKQYHSENNFYHFINAENKGKAKIMARELSGKWLSLTEDDKINLLKDPALWNCVRYPFDFYFSYEFMYSLILCYLTYKKIFQQKHLKAAVITSQHNIYERCLNAAASKYKIPVILIQHGAGTGSINPELLPPYTITALSDHYKKLLMEKKVSEKDILVSGPLIFDDIFPFVEKKQHKNQNKATKILILTVPFVEQNYFSTEKHQEYISSMLREIQKVPNTQIIIKLHPLEKNLKDYQKIIDLNTFQNITVVQKTGASYLYQLMSESNIVINFSSTVVLESVILDKPIITMISKEFQNPFNAIITESKATIEVAELGNLSSEITKLLTDEKVQQELHQNRIAFKEKFCGKIDGQAAARVAAFVKQLVQDNKDNKEISRTRKRK